MAIKVGGTTVINDSKKGIFETVNPGQYTTANRPSNPVEGDVIYDTDEKNIYVWNGTEWVTGGGGDFEPPVLVSNILTQDQVNGNRFTNNNFTSTLNNTGGDATDCLMTATVTGTLAIEAGTQPITTNSYPGTSSTEVELTLEGTANLGGGVFEVNDVVKANASHTPVSDSIGNVDAEKLWRKEATWSTQISGGTAPPTNAFDGNTGTFYNTVSSGTVTWDASVFNITGSNIETFNNGLLTVTTNVKEYTAYSQNAAVGAVLSIEFDGEETIQTLTTYAGTGAPGGQSGYGTSLSYIKVDGKMLVDTGIPGDPVSGNSILTLSGPKDIKLFQEGDVVQGQTIDKSRRWSSGFSGSLYSGYTYEKAFNGDFSGNDGATPSNGSTLTLTFNPKISATKVKLIGNLPDNPTAWVKINNDNVSDQVSSWGEEQEFNYPEGFELETISFNRTTSTDGLILKGVLLDDVLLIDDNASFVEDTVKIISTDVSARTITVDGGKWDTSNQSQVWSSGTKSGSTYRTYSWTAAFNGTITGSPGSAHTVIQASGDFTQLDFTGFSSISSVKVVYYGGTGGQIYINYGEPSQQLHAATTKGDPGEGVQPSHTFTASELKNIRLTNPSSDNAPYLYAIYVDGKLLVDAVNDSQVWSSGWSGDFLVANSKSLSFDGNVTDNVADYTRVNGTLTWTKPTESITTFTTLKIYGFVKGTGATSQSMVVNGVDVSNQFSSGASGTWGWTEVTGVGSELTSIVMKGDTSNTTGITAIELDGKLLLDKGVRDLGDTKVSTASPKQGQGTISAINGTAVTIEPITDNCFKEGRHLVHVTPKPVLVNPKTDVINTIDGNNLTFASDKDLYQFADGDPVYMCNADGSVATATYTTDVITNVEPESAWNQTQTWSTQFTTTGTINSSVTDIVDGIYVADAAGGANYAGILAQPNATVTWNIPAGLTGAVRVFGVPANYQYGAGATITASNGTNRLDNTGQWLYIGEAEDLTYITFSGNGFNFGPSWQAIEVDGKQLVDPAFTGAPTTSNTVLTFNSATNLDKFKDGDTISELGTGISTYTGNGGSQAVSVGFPADLMWIKARDTSGTSHAIFDTLRGNDKRLKSDSNALESTTTTTVTTSPNGFTVTGSAGAINGSGKSMIAWCWSAGDGIPVTNTLGETESSVKASTETGFSIVKWVGNGANTTIGHGLGQVPSFILTKNLDASSSWKIFHDGGVRTGGSGSFSPFYWFTFDSSAKNGSANQAFTNTRPTTNVFSFAAAANVNNQIAYCWSEVAGVSSFGSYTGTKSAGLKITTGFTPAWVLIRKTNGGDWFIFDSTRGTSNPVYARLYANLSNEEDTGTANGINFVSDGFEIATTHDGLNQVAEYIYAAFSEASMTTVVDVLASDSKLVVDNSNYSLGETLSKAGSGVGVVDSTDSNANTMTLKSDSNNGEWFDGYYVATPEKPASSTKGYVRFDSTGAVECIESYPLEPINMLDKDAPKLKFPAEFECVQSPPDSELGASTFLQTEVKLKNLFGESATRKSNILTPQTTTYSVAAGYAALNTTEYAESAAKIKTQSERAAQMRVDNAQQTLEEWRTDFTDEANNYSI